MKSKIKDFLSYVRETWVAILVLTAFFSLRWLFQDNVGIGTVNEANMLPFARQHIDPGWIPQDWYLNLPPGYRVLFIQTFGRMAAAWGFLATSIAGRLLGYTFIASALVFLSRRLKLSLPPLLLAVTLLLYRHGINSGAGVQGAAAHEWLIAGIEPKIPAYGLIFYAIGLMLSGQLLWMALLLGLATSWHTLVGGWAFLVAMGWLVLRRRAWLFGDWRRLGLMLVVYALAGCLAIAPILQQLSDRTSTGLFPASFAYVFLRTPHHLNPLSWRGDWWLQPLCLLLLLALSVGVLRRQPERSYRLGLAEFTLVSLIPFAIGLMVAPFDKDGKLLQYYLFRFADLMLPLNTFLLFACALEQLGERWQKALRLGCIVLVSVICCLRLPDFVHDIHALRNYPGVEQRVTQPEKELYAWIQQHTPRESIVVTSPIDLTIFSWMTERATIAKYRLVPPTGAGIASWLERLTDLSGDVNPWAKVKRTRDNRHELQRRLTAGYNRLSTGQATALMKKYHAGYIVVSAKHPLTLPIAHANSQYILYSYPQ